MAMIGTERHPGRQVRGLVLSGLGALMVLGTPVAAQAQSGLIDVTKSLLGVQEEKPEPIYRERPPLVVPPKLTLREPKPQQTDPTNWPKDPDVQRARAMQAERKKPAEPLNPKGAPTALSVDEMRAGRVAGVGLGREPDAPPGFGPTGPTYHPSAMTPTQLRGNGTSGAETAYVEPERRYLTDPPKGYRKAAPGAPVEAPKTVLESIATVPSPLDIFRKSTTE
jgi:hypothetical protein